MDEFFEGELPKIEQIAKMIRTAGRGLMRLDRYSQAEETLKISSELTGTPSEEVIKKEKLLHKLLKMKKVLSERKIKTG